MVKLKRNPKQKFVTKQKKVSKIRSFDSIQASKKTQLKGNHANKPSKAVEEYTKDLIGQKITVLDYGSGSGRNGKYLQRKGHDVYFYDINSERKQYRTSNNLPRVNKRFDLILVNYVLNTLTIRERRRVLQEIKHYGNDKTEYLFEVRGYGQVDSETWENFSDGYLTNSGTFQKFYHKDELKDYLQANGFVITKEISNNNTKISLIAKKKGGY